MTETVKLHVVKRSFLANGKVGRKIIYEATLSGDLSVLLQPGFDAMADAVGLAVSDILPPPPPAED